MTRPRSASFSGLSAFVRYLTVDLSYLECADGCVPGCCEVHSLLVLLHPSGSPGHNNACGMLADAWLWSSGRHLRDICDNGSTMCMHRGR